MSCEKNQASAKVESAFSNLYSVVYVTTPSKEVALKLAKGLVEKELAACVNTIPGIVSIYKWEDKIQEDEETLMMIKTRTSKVPHLTQYVKDNHPYTVCEVISVPIQSGNQPYLDWISKTVPE